MNQILHCDWLPNRARWCPSWPQEINCPHGIARRVVQENGCFCSTNFSGQVFMVKRAGYWPRSFLCYIMTIFAIKVSFFKKGDIKN